MSRSVVFGVALASLIYSAAPAYLAAQEISETRVWTNANLTPDERVKALLGSMNQDEKLTLLTGYFGSSIPQKNYVPTAEARAGSAGFVPGIPRLGIPTQWQTDAGVGVATQGSAAKMRERTALPSGLATAATWNPEGAFKAGAMIGAEARASGFNVMLAGGVNLLRDPGNGRNFEYGGEDPLLAGIMVGRQVAGIQSNHVLSTVKHFALNDQETERDAVNAVLDPAAARASDLLAFQIAMEESDAGAVMCAYNRVNGPFACESPWLLTEVLRRDWGWMGFVMSDWGGVHSTVSAANAGLEQQSGYPFDEKPFFGTPLREAVATQAVSQARLDEMVSRILRSMFAHGLFDHPVRAALVDLPQSMLDAGAEVSRKAAEEGAVLLKNDNAVLPLSPRIRNVVVIGGHADKGVLAGGGSSLVHPVGGNAVPGLEPKSWPGPVMYYPSSPLAAIRRQAPNARVSFVDGKDLAAAVAAAKGADVAIVFATQWAGEAFDVPLALGDNQDALITAVSAANAKTVVVLETGGPVLTPWVNQVGALLAAWYPGTQGGDAIANLLFGRENPSGRLPATFPASVDQLPRPAPPTGTVTYSEGAAVGYKWYERKGLKPAFAFGHGLSYTRFAYSALAVSLKGGNLTASFTVRNVGQRPGRDVPQIYVSGRGWEAPKRLGGFQKLSLKPGESKAVTVTVEPLTLAVFDPGRNKWQIAPGSYQVLLGTSSAAIVQSLTVELPAQTIDGALRLRASGH